MTYRHLLAFVLGLTLTAPATQPDTTPATGLITALTVDLPDGYYLTVAQTGDWELGYVNRGERHRLTAGHTDLTAGAWHTIEITTHGTTISAAIKGAEVGRAVDDTYARGRAGIGTGWNRVQFDDFSVSCGWRINPSNTDACPR